MAPQNIRTIVLGVMAPVLSALSTTHSRVTLAIATLVTAINGKANIQHTHLTADITNLSGLGRNVLETLVNTDGLTITLPWVIDGAASLDVFIAGLRLPTSTLSVTANILTLESSVTGGTAVSIIWYKDSVYSTGAQIDTPFISGLSVFNSYSATKWDTGASDLGSGDTVFNNYGYAKWNTGASDLGSGDTVFNGVGPGEYT